MGNAESEHQINSDDEETYDYHKKVLKEGSTPVKGSTNLPDTPESSNDGFEDARNDVGSDLDQSNNSDSYSGSSPGSADSYTGSSGSVTGSSSSVTGSSGSVTGSSSSVTGSSGSVTGSNVSFSGSSCSGSTDQSPASGSDVGSVSASQSTNRSISSSATSRSDRSARSGVSTGSLPNRIRVIDTESEDEEETESTSTATNPSKQLNFSGSNDENIGRPHKNLPRPIPIHKGTSSHSQAGNSQETAGHSQASHSQGGNFPGSVSDEVKGEELTRQTGQVKRKADEMEPEVEEENQMSVPVRKNGGMNRPFARKRELRDMVLGQRISSGPSSKSSSSQMQDENEEQTNKEIMNVDEQAETGQEVNKEKSSKEMQIRFEHSNNSPFKNFHLQPSSSTAGADLSAMAETPRESSDIPNFEGQSGVKRSTSDPDPSTSKSKHDEMELRSQSDFNQPSTSGFGKQQESQRILPNRGNTGKYSSNKSSDQSSCEGIKTEMNAERKFGQDHWTSQLPKVNVAAAENRFQGITRNSPSPTTSDWQKTILSHHGDRYSFVLADTLNVHICYDDITSLRTDALVNPTDGQLTHVNETARTITTATGPQMTNQCQFFLRQHGGPLETTEVIETYACGSLSGRVGHVVHLAMPLYEAANEKSSVQKLLTSYLNCLSHINDKLGLVSVVFPCIGAGSYPQDTCINVFFESLLVHLAERKNARIKSVKFVVSDVHLANLAIAMIQAHLERSILEGIDILMAEALNSYYGNSKWECHQNSVNDQLGRQLEVDSQKKLFRGPPVKRPKL